MFWHAVEADLAAAVRPRIRTGVVASAQTIGGPLGLRFDLTNPAAVRVIDDQIATLVRDITAESQRAIRTTLARGFQDGRTVPQMARDIRNHVGLTTRDANAVANFRRAQTGNQMQIAERTERLADRLLSRRATNIARTETIRATTLGQQVAWHEARQTGLLSYQAMQTWIITDDNSTCPICLDMDGETISLGGTFSSGVSGPPAHPSCRCALGLVFPEEATGFGTP